MRKKPHLDFSEKENTERYSVEQKERSLKIKEAMSYTQCE